MNKYLQAYWIQWTDDNKDQHEREFATIRELIKFVKENDLEELEEIENNE